VNATIDRRAVPSKLAAVTLTRQAYDLGPGVVIVDGEVVRKRWNDARQEPIQAILGHGYLQRQRASR
jgi:hypothetical protein